MKLYFPKNVFTSILAASLPEKLKSNFNFHPSSSVSSLLENDKECLALITPTDLLNHKSLFVSKKFGISFENSLCNSYLYYSENRSLNTLNIAGDVSSLEAVMSRILFKELYGTEVEISLSTSMKKEKNNLLLVGEQNFYEDKLFDGISFSEEIIELLSLPFVNFILASSSEDLLKENESLLMDIIPEVYDSFGSIQHYYSFSDKMMKYINENISSLVLEFDLQDIEGIIQLTRLPYYYGLIKDMVDIKFV
ncbi:MAG TPA: hypothetical protein VLB50_14560 [Ignavibacteriaceae bacterium]|nr:hypothetical protein [Ignavibacteriaceae bacterium]